MRLPPKIPQRAMVRIWVASLHQELRYPMGTGVSVLPALKKGLQGWIRTASTRRIVRRGKAPVQQRRPLPAAETGRSCWGCGQQDARAAQGTMQPLGAATRVPLIHPRPPKNRNVSKYAAVLFYDTFSCCFCFALPSEQLCKNTVLHNKPGGGQGENAAIEGGVPGADTVLHKGQLCGGKLLAVQSFVGFKVKPLAQTQL